MVLVTCPCLNIKISLRDPDLSSAPKADSPSFATVDARSEKFFCRAKSVRPTPGGLCQEHGSFIRKQSVGPWHLYTCVLCDTPTYAEHSRADDDDSTILINPDLISDADTIDRLHNSSNFSPAFRVCLTDATSSLSIPHAASLDFLPYIQQEATSYIVAMETAMEQRIRKFEQEERTKFIEIENRLKSDKKKLISLVLQNSQENLNTQSPSKKSLTHSFSSPVQVNDNHGPHKSVANHKSPARREEFLLDDDDDELFHMDGTEDSNEMSDDDGLDTDDSSAIERSSSPGLFSTSYPVSVPAWKNTNSPFLLPDDPDENDVAPGIDQIHANIQALAKSVHDSSKEIFGDLPRPRLNTYSGRQTHR